MMHVTGGVLPGTGPVLPPLPPAIYGWMAIAICGF